jgi:transglutaminase-like putative cysteine protease
MGSISGRSIWLAAAALCALILPLAPAAAELATPPAPSATDPDRNSPAHTMAVDARIRLRPDLTSTMDYTVRFKILRESAIRTLGQQNLSYVESLNPLEVVEAYTEKPDGRRIVVEQANILTRDAATGLNAIYQRDAKVKTLIFPDIAVGDTLIYVSRVERIDKRYPGHFSFQTVLSRSVPYDTYRLTLDAPKSLALRIHVKGDGLSHEAAEAGEHRRHVFSYRPTGWAIAEPGAVSVWDRDPQLVITTFKDVAELGANYWSSMRGPDVAPPEIRSLADDITKGIVGKRAQAEAIDHWVKKNIRYVAVFLGSAGVTPNPPAAVLRNKYGDCKDHVALMGALLKAKGIASEQALVNLGNTYRLPELAVPFFNHVMLYLPEFDLYTDPTAAQASFAVLPESSYDKPVLHISAAGGRLARTPPMKPDDHVATTRTTASIAADGTVKGTTRQTATGAFAVAARRTATRIQTEGREKYAETLLRSLGRPGTGVFEPAAPFDLSEPYAVHGDFSLNEKLQMPLNGARDIPFGMPIHGRPGVRLLGQRLADRKTDFVCYAGKQVEEIELTFADGLPLPRVPRGNVIDTKHFSYLSSYTLQHRKLTIRHEFTSKVAGQVCAKEIESDISEPLRRVARSLRTQMSFPAAPDGGKVRSQ